MEKGHMVLAALLFCMMICLPAVAVTGGESAASSPAQQFIEWEAGKTIQVLRTDTDQVEEYSLKDYLFGVVAAEMPMSYGDEALKAQTVAAYTLFLHRQNHPNQTLEKGDITDSSQKDQAFITREIARAKWGEHADQYEERLNEVVDAVLGQYLSYNKEPALTVYHSISGGRTESASLVWGGDYPYLVPVESVGDVMSEGYISEKTVSKEQLISALKKMDSSISLGGDLVGDIKRSESGTVQTVVLGGKSFTGSQIRSAFSLRSANFDVELKDNQIVFTVRGYGHGVGMSQYGAKTMAEQGSTYKEILNWYYPGCEIVTDN